MKMQRLLSIDTNIFIYHFQKNSEFGSNAKKVFETLASGQTKAITNIITLTELLAINSTKAEVTYLEKLFLEITNLTVYDLTYGIAYEAARIRREYRFRLADAIQLATALYGKADAFITNDERLKKFKEVKVMLIGKIK